MIPPRSVYSFSCSDTAMQVLQSVASIRLPVAVTVIFVSKSKVANLKHLSSNRLTMLLPERGKIHHTSSIHPKATCRRPTIRFRCVSVKQTRRDVFNLAQDD